MAAGNSSIFFKNSATIPTTCKREIVARWLISISSSIGRQVDENSHKYKDKEHKITQQNQKCINRT